MRNCYFIFFLQVFKEICDKQATLIIFPGRPEQMALFIQACQQENLAVSMHAWHKCKLLVVLIATNASGGCECFRIVSHLWNCTVS